MAERRRSVPLRLVQGTGPERGTRSDGLVSIVLPGRRHSVAVGRHWVVDIVTTRGVTGRANQIVELLSSELLANAVVHGPPGGVVTVQVDVDDERVRVTVADTGAGEPVVLHRDPSALTGRGMAIVDALATRWGAEADDAGTEVWFEIGLDED